VREARGVEKENFKKPDRYTRYQVTFHTRDRAEVSIRVFTSSGDNKAIAMATGNFRRRYPKAAIDRVDLATLSDGLVVGDVKSDDVVDRYEL
jgi:hypothetical protein